ncbi:MAG: signal recognition particle-docking protein FtsY [Phycisphaerales bacterium]|jgi:fused signal recognition particle receptor|nr:signal recognition particle-docking protein FtsY [Planctomycetota bacterium]
MGIFTAAAAALRRGLSRTAETLVGLTAFLAGRRIDEDLLGEVEGRLLSADVGVTATRELVDALRRDWKAGRISTGEEVVPFLKAELRRRWEGVDLSLARCERKPTVILVVGVNGSGKTTSVAKIAASLKAEGRTVLLAAADTFRAGAVRQLEIWSERLGVELVKGVEGGDPAAVVFDAADAALARGVDVLLVDTAGRLHTQDSLMRQLSKLRSVLAKKIPDAPHETLLVLDATAGQNAIRQAEVFTEAAEVTGIFLSKLDGTARGGVVMAIRDQMGLPVKLVGVGERPEDVEAFDPETFVEAMFAEND